MAINNVNKLKNLYKKVAPHICKSSRTTTNTYATKNKVKYTQLSQQIHKFSLPIARKEGKEAKEGGGPEKIFKDTAKYRKWPRPCRSNLPRQCPISKSCFRTWIGMSLKRSCEQIKELWMQQLISCSRCLQIIR